jgi:hypothetical protein
MYTNEILKGSLPSYEELDEQGKKEYKDAAQEIYDETTRIPFRRGVPENSDGVRQMMFPSFTWTQKMLFKLNKETA